MKKTSLEGTKLDGIIIASLIHLDRWGIVSDCEWLACIAKETTGLADPAPVAQTFFADDVIQSKMMLARMCDNVCLH